MTGTSVLRFAPSPNGRLHLGHAYSALLNEAMARRLGGRLILRIEDIDPVRSRPELVAALLDDLAWLGIAFEEPVRRQSEHMASYRAALDGLTARGLAYPCFCSRGEIAAAVASDGPRDPDGSPLYPGTCRRLAPEEAARRITAGEPHSRRIAMDRALAEAPGRHGYTVFDREDRHSPAPADPSRWGEAVIARRDVPTSYHLAVVLDDAAQGITHVVRGQDLEAATDLHVLLQALLGLPSPAYHHHALMLGADGQKLAKSKGSESLADLRARGLGPSAIRERLGFR